jgi:predicted lipoprotein with Yx(FWY)xxD motif
MKLKSLAPLVFAVAVAAIVVVALAAGGSAKSRQAHVAGGSAVTITHTPVGQTLVDANGRTLYLFEADKHNVSTLSAAGRAVWPPFTAAGRIKAGSGVQAGKLGTTSSGVKQVTYNGHPLYYYVGDHGPGSVKGQNLKEFGALWFALAPSGNANTATAAAATTPQPAPTPAPTSSYGY